jgi:hypothetical protein
MSRVTTGTPPGLPPSQLTSDQRRLATLFAPVRPHVRADDPALRAHHPRSERGHGHIPREMVDVHHGLVVALVAVDRE